MPIKGLTDVRRMPRLGKIHLGVKRPDGSPMAVDYFVCPPEVQKVFGEKPIELPILIPVEDPEQWASQFYRAYSQTRGLVCKGDGEGASCTVDKATGKIAGRDSKEVERREIPCKGRGCPNYQAKRCREIMNLQFLLPDVPGAWGVWQLDTSSINSIININNSARLIQAIFRRVRMIPLLLTLEPQDVISPEDGKKKKVRCLNLRTREKLRDLMELMRAEDGVIGLLGQGEPPQVELPESDDEAPDLLVETQEEPPPEVQDEPPLDSEVFQVDESDEVETPLDTSAPKPGPQATILLRLTRARERVGWSMAEVHNWLLANVNYGKPWHELTREQQEQVIEDLNKMEV